MHFQITTWAYQFLEQNFLNDLKKESKSRSKPAKSVIDALKHSTSLNKSFKIRVQQFQSQICSLKSELTSSIDENQFLKIMVDKLNGQLELLKNSRQERIQVIHPSFQKLYQTESQLHTKIEFLLNQNGLLKKQIELLKEKLHFNIGDAIQNKFMDNLSFQLQKQNSNPSPSIIKNQNKKCESNLFPSISLYQSVKFKEYVNFQGRNQKNQSTRANSKLRIQFYEEPQEQTPKMKKVGTYQSEQFSAMLSLKEDSKDFNTNSDKMSPCMVMIPSIESLTPQIIQIYSEQQLQNNNSSRRIQTPTLQKCRFNPNQSKFKVFQDDLKVSVQGSYKGYRKSSEITFLNLQTNKSIEEGLEKSQYPQIHNRIVNECIEQKDESFMDCLNAEENHQLHNISGVNYNGLLDDIYLQKDNDSHDDQNTYQRQFEENELFYKTQGFDLLKYAKKISNAKSKRSLSEIYQPQKVETIIDGLKDPSQQSGLPSIQDKLPTRYKINQSMQKNDTFERRLQVPQRGKKRQQQQVNIAVHCPTKYMSIAQSFKTIELNKSYRQLNSNENKSIQAVDKINETQRSNQSSFLAKSKSSCSKSMTNSKLMIYSNSRKNKNKSFSPLSIENEVSQKYKKSAQKQNGSQKSTKSQYLIHSVSSKIPHVSVTNNQSSLVSNTNNEPYMSLPNASVIMNYSIFRKRIDETLTQSTHPMITFKDIQNQCQERSYQFDRLNDQ